MLAISYRLPEYEDLKNELPLKLINVKVDRLGELGGMIDELTHPMLDLNTMLRRGCQ
jgi:hypothetical protein